MSTPALALALLAPLARAQDAPPPPAPDAPRVEAMDATLSFDPHDTPRVELAPIVWFGALAGDIQIAPGGSFDVERIDADEPNIAVGASARVDADRLTFSLSGFHLAADASDQATDEATTIGALALPRGTSVDWDLELTSIKATAGYRFRPILDEGDVSLRFDAYAGARFTDMDITIDALGASERFDESWGVPLVGARMHVDLPRGFALLVESDIGALPLGDTETFVWEIFAGGTWSPSRNVGLRAGFRHISLSYTDETGPGDNEFDGFLAGLYAGLVIRF
jgi:hypothetical protein